MQYGAGPISALFFGAWKGLTESTTFLYTKDNETNRISYPDIESINVSSGILWNELAVTANSQTLHLKGLTKKKARLLRDELTSKATKAVITHALHHDGPLITLANWLSDFYSLKKYISRSDLTERMAKLDDVDAIVEHPFFDTKYFPDTVQANIATLSRIKEPAGEYITQVNDRFVQAEIQKFSSLFNRLEDFPLSSEQMRAVVVNEDRTLLIAAAGSGKTATIVAKAIYLIAAGYAAPQQILLLAYNKDAQLELQERLVSLQGITPEYNEAPKVRTFHGFGYEVLTNYATQSPSISKFATSSGKQQGRLFAELIKNLYQKDTDFKRLWREFLLVDKFPTPNLFEIQTQRDYHNHLQELGAKRRKLPEGFQLMIPTLDGKEVRSFEEARLANWLAINGVNYEYEREYR
ncbi:MAG: UvrD-helicase domain-containing protein, partial [Gammaproteobacteria bacterium]|nr:UvrD-helicase domain-containing protein [Gammaproteobacteria bacterium]